MPSRLGTAGICWDARWFWVHIHLIQYIYLNTSTYIYIYTYMHNLCIFHNIYIYININRGKFRTQTSDNMDRWKSRGGKIQRVEAKKWEDQRRERVRRKKMQVRKKVGKSRFTVFFQWVVAPEGRKVGSLERRVRSHLAKWEMKNCTP